MSSAISEVQEVIPQQQDKGFFDRLREIFGG
jgi:hypothetical protein